MARVGSTARRWLELAVVLIVVTVVAGCAVPWLIAPSSVDQVESVLRSMQAAILFVAAGLGLLSGRWAARTSAGFACATLVVLAFAGITSATSLGQTGFGPVMYTAGAALAVALLLAAAAAPEVTDAASFRQLLTRDSGPVALLAVAALTPVVEAVLVAGMTMPLPARIILSALVAGGCFIAGAQLLRLDRPRLGWLPAVLLGVAVAAVVCAFVGVWSGFLLITLALDALAGTFALVGAVVGVRRALTSTTDGMTSMLQDLGVMRDADSKRRAEEVERLHEVRSVLAGLHAATGSLRKYEDSLDPGVRRRLQDAVGDELTRLNRLIDPDTPEVTEELDLEAALMSVVVAEREQGLVVTTDLGHVVVRGRATDIATLVSDLLVNARIHAPGSAVRLTAHVDGEMVTLEVRNWGPRLSAMEAEHVFERAYRGTGPIAQGVPGSGLGLYTARKLAREMHGDLIVQSPAGGGCCFVVTLPAARGGDHGAPSLQQVDHGLEAVNVHHLQHDAPQHLRLPSQHTNLPIDRSQLIQIIAGNEVDIHRHASDQDSSQRTPGRLRKKLASTRRRTRRRQGGPR
jgi:signal transduction histidine kinase